jgi:hypothetical protein
MLKTGLGGPFIICNPGRAHLSLAFIHSGARSRCMDARLGYVSWCLGERVKKRSDLRHMAATLCLPAYNSRMAA